MSRHKREIALLFTDQPLPNSPLPTAFSTAIQLDLDDEFEAKVAALIEATGARTVHCFERKDRESENKIAGCLLPRDCEIVWHPLETKKASGLRSSKTRRDPRKAH